MRCANRSRGSSVIASASPVQCSTSVVGHTAWTCSVQCCSRGVRCRADGNELLLTLPRRWLDARPLLEGDLGGEPEDMAGLGITLTFAAH